MALLDILFDRKAWTRESAIDWLKVHGYKIADRGFTSKDIWYSVSEEFAGLDKLFERMKFFNITPSIKMKIGFFDDLDENK